MCEGYEGGSWGWALGAYCGEALVWARVLRPAVPLLYLDLNHLIGLARVTTGAASATAAYRDLLESVERAVRERRVMVVLSGDHLYEILAIADPRQRRDIAEVAEALSGFQYLLGRLEIARLELEAGIDAALQAQNTAPAYLPLIGPSFGRAFGMRGGLRIVDDATGIDLSETTRRDMGEAAYDAVMKRMNRELEFAMLSGPADDEIAVRGQRLRARGRERESTLPARLRARPLRAPDASSWLENWSTPRSGHRTRDRA